MGKFKCKEESCEAFGIEVTVSKVSFTWDEKQKKLVIRNKQYCVACGNEMEYIEEPPKSGVQGFCFTKFNTLSSDEKKAAMKKRSQKVFDKKERRDVEEYKKQIIKDNRRMAEGKM